MPHLAAICYGCPFCESGASSGVEFALHLEEHFLEGAERWLRAVLPRVVEHPEVALALADAWPARSCRPS